MKKDTFNLEEFKKQNENYPKKHIEIDTYINNFLDALINAAKEINCIYYQEGYCKLKEKIVNCTGAECLCEVGGT